MSSTSDRSTSSSSPMPERRRSTSTPSSATRTCSTAGASSTIRAPRRLRRNRTSCTMTNSTRTTSNRATLRNALAALGLGLALAGSAALADQSPSQVVDGLANRVLPILRDKSLSTDQKRDQIEQIAYQAIDFETLSKLVLARNWPKFSHHQQVQFVAQFKRNLSVTYSHNI